ncbi:hypothetical protein [uncultured Arthrobacter sp.]|uniref:hypothetical protein n=1 Tax=uncultured Arthrobacter sp. TaxID=114050 RepID=UPI0028D090DB|nr:hypothetical protein [uncultured Arthrobacter sp.]
MAATGGGLLALTAVAARPAAATTLPTPPPEPLPSETAEPVPTDPPVVAPEPVPAITKATIGLSEVDNTSDLNKPVSIAQQAALDGKADDSGLLRGISGKSYRVVACAIRNTSQGFQVINDAAHTPVGVSSITTAKDGMSVTIGLSFQGASVSSVVAAPDETLAAAGYVVGASVGLGTITLFASQPGGFGDYVSWNGSRWVSLNGLITSTTMNGTTGLVTCTHANMSAPYGGSVTSRSLTKRASMEGVSATSTSLYLVDSAGKPVKTPTTDSRFWITRTGARRAGMAELAKAGSNIWVYGMLESD